MPGAVADAFATLGRGMNGAMSPVILAQDQYARGINLTVRGALAKTRPGFVQLELDVPSGLFQGAGVWSLETGDRIGFVVAGNVYIYFVETGAIQDMGALMSATRQCFVYQADRYLVVQDGESEPGLFRDVSGVVEPVPAWDYPSPDAPEVTVNGPSVPVGYIGVYAHGRLHLVPRCITNTGIEDVECIDGRDSLVSGDIKMNDEPRTVLEFTETEYLNGGGAHALPLEIGFIGGLGVYRNAATGTGNGEVVVFGRNGVVAFDFALARDMQWTAAPLSRVLFQGAGCKSPWSVVSVNDDLLYRSQEGIRALRYTVSQTAAASGSLSNVPASIEISTFLSGDGAYLPFVSGALSDNRFYMTVGGTQGSLFKGLVVWDLGAAYYSGVDATGIFDGMWTGANFAQAVTVLRAGTPTTYVFASGPVLYRIDSSAIMDYPLAGGPVPIESQLQTRAFLFGDSLNVKQLRRAELWVSGLKRDTEFTVYYRPHGYPLWTLLGSREFKVGDGSMSQIRRRVNIPLDFSADSCDASSGQALYSATEFQFAIVWTGHATIERFRVEAEPLGEAPLDSCDDETAAVLAESASSGQVLSDFSYTIGGS